MTFESLSSRVGAVAVRVEHEVLHMYDFVDLIVKKDVETALVDFEQRMEHRIDSSGGVGAVNFARLGVDFGSTVEGEVIAIPFEAPPAAAALVVVVAVIDFPEVP